MIPSGGIFSELRSRMLSAFPEGTQASWKDRSTFGDWLLRGYYNVSSSTSKTITLNVSTIDFSGAVFVEIQNLFNHCIEQFNELCILPSEEDLRRSAAWSLVTAYYLGFFSVSIFNRLVGQSIVFVSSEQLSRLKTLGATASGMPSGAYKVDSFTPISATDSELVLRHRGRPHESNWKEFLTLVHSCLKKTSKFQTAEEVEFWSALVEMPARLLKDPAWPSSIRHRFNYGPGFAYQLERRKSAIEKGIQDFNAESAIQYIRNVIRLSTHSSTDVDSKNNQACLVLGGAVGIFAASCSLYVELDRRRTFDRRWSNERSSYVQDEKCSLKKMGAHHLVNLIA